jgi:hypothetical protein
MYDREGILCLQKMYSKQSERVMSDNRKRWLKLAQRLVTYDTEDELIQVAGITIRELADRITELEAALAEKTEWCIEIDELAVKLKTQREAVKQVTENYPKNADEVIHRILAAIGESDG